MTQYNIEQCTIKPRAMLIAFITGAMFWGGLGYAAFGQDAGRVVTACSTRTYTVGTNQPITLDPNGDMCVEAVVTPAGTQDVNVVEVGGNALTTTVPVSGTVAATQSGAWNVGQSGAPWNIQGDVAHDAVDSGNPVKVGGVANTTTPASVAAGDRVNSTYSVYGAQLATPIILSATSGGDASNQASLTSLANATTTTPIGSADYIFNGTNWDRMRTIVGAATTGTGVLATADAPTSSANVAIVPVVSTAVETGHVIKASAGNLYGLSVTTGAAAGYVMVHNSTTVPVAGAVTPIKCEPVAANAGISLDFDPPIRLSTGISISFSTTGCFTQTNSATAFISAQAL
jgi:hypothetical protein